MSYSVTIGGQKVTVLAGSLSIDSTIGKRSTASFTLHTTTATHFQQYSQVAIYDQNNVLAFSGYVTSPKEQKPGFQNSLLHTITCCDQHYLADKRVIAAQYTNRTCGSIVTDIAQRILAQEGVTIGQIYDGPTPSNTLYPSTTLYPGGNVGLIPSAVFTYCTVSDALDALVTAASASGVPYYWQIDQNKQLWFVPYTAIVNSTLVDGSAIDQINNPCTVTRANPTYRNMQYVLGGVAQTVTQTEARVGDSNTQSWTMGYALNSAPTITVNGASQTVGLKGTTGSQFYWAQGDAVITQDSAQTKLSGAQTLQVVYIGQYPAVIVSQQGAQVSYQASVDGSSGIVEAVQQDATLTSLSNGISEASQLLTRYAVQGTVLSFWTLVSGFAAGQLITVNLTAHNLNSVQMLIEEVIATDQSDSHNIWYNVVAVLGPYDITWVDFFSKLLKQPQTANSINVGVSQSITLLESFTTTIKHTATLNVFVTACPIPNTTLFPSTTLYPC